MQHEYNATQVPPEWHSWLHHVRKEAPPDDRVMQNLSPPWKGVCAHCGAANMLGTDFLCVRRGWRILQVLAGPTGHTTLQSRRSNHGSPRYTRGARSCIGLQYRLWTSTHTMSRVQGYKHLCFLRCLPCRAVLSLVQNVINHEFGDGKR